MDKRVKVIYRRNLKMSAGKLASQVAHAVIGLGVTDPLMNIVVLKASDAAFDECIYSKKCYVHIDSGLTEVARDEMTCAAWFEG